MLQETWGSTSISLIKEIVQKKEKILAQTFFITL
jgi:hypothetical protein